MTGNKNSFDFKLDLMDILLILKRRYWVILIVAAVFLGFGIRSVKRLPIVYVAQTTLMLRNDFGDKNVENIATLLEIAKSKTITQRVIDKYGLTPSAGALAGGINIYPVRNTEFLKLTYTGSDPKMTAAIANEVAIEFIKKVEEVLNRANLKILELAEVPKYPKPIDKKKILFKYLFMGVALSSGVLVVLEFINKRLRRSVEIEKILDCEILGVLPDLKKYYSKKEVKENMRRGIFFESENLKEGGEAIRLIRSNINFMDTTDHKIITFCSSVPKEGKTTIASNYALSEAITGKKVLLIDCDIKRPRINEVYETEHKKGIVELLEGKATFEEVIQREVRKNLDIIFCSKKREETTELILSKNLESHLKELQSEYDLIVVDTPPLTIGTDAAIISRFSTGVVFVISYDQVHRVELEFAKKLLTTAKANLYGAVINKVSTDGYFYEPYGYYSYNYKYYKNYYKDGEK